MAEETYVVSLPMRVSAESPEAAVQAFIEQINTFGLRAWTYTVAHAEGETSAQTITGRGVVIVEEEEEQQDGEAVDVAAANEPD